jgi:hypothetical protein
VTDTNPQSQESVLSRSPKICDHFFECAPHRERPKEGSRMDTILVRVVISPTFIASIHLKFISVLHTSYLNSSTTSSLRLPATFQLAWHTHITSSYTLRNVPPTPCLLSCRLAPVSLRLSACACVIVKHCARVAATIVLTFKCYFY